MQFYLKHAIGNRERWKTGVMLSHASAVILAHNHRSGVALPSVEDETSTARLARALDLLGVELSDHIIVAGNDYVSMREGGFMR